ncbi:DNA helicase RecQ [Thermoleptolyngbya oregonensis NK1-22]|uniref:DNA helicase RecQ n=1 Tax=Thermoleptolyngbya oregonensis NK1-22 TaxID=2547457 RepID=A0AA96YRK2_9CYAN|nr:DNA helicase RecQ [Thermoleptolyngbya oregonensis]WOB45097.1 DNA helicase RecQ [Thermoleptolyngbya oregonensis NK1-22]
MPTPEEALKFYFGYDAFRPGQREIVEAAIAQRDQLVIMPTGGGKSICYQLPALLMDGVTIVVSPLIALMQDQVQALQDNGIGAAFLNSSLGPTELRSTEQAVLAGQIKLLYVAPERLMGDRFLPFLERIDAEVGIAAFAIDEAHCLSEWGHDFRPEYRQLKTLRQRYPAVPMTALTATATHRVQEDIVAQLTLRHPRIHVASFNRTNLYYEVRPKQRDVYRHLLQLIRQTPGAGIVYCLSRKKVDELAFRLQQDGIEALPYHAGLEDEIRAANQTRFIRDDVRVMVATVAFGMGINKPDVRFVIHYDLPRSLENYYQEAGRAGRDGDPAKCTLFFGYGDLNTVEFLISQKVDPTTGEPLEDEQRIARQQLRRVVDYAEGTECRRKIQLAYFGESFAGQCGNCDNCLHPRPVEDWTIDAQKLLSCIARCKERFGMNHIIDVLRGSRSQKVLQHGHDQLSTYGIGKDRSAEAWKHLGRSLLHQGLMDETTDGYSIPKLNAQSWEVMRGQRTVMIALPARSLDEPAPVGDRFLKQTGPKADSLFERLRQLRKRLADAQNVPPYVVFSDVSLRQMAEKQPHTLREFARISGVGSRKLKQYGETFVTEIRDFCTENDIPLRSPSLGAIPGNSDDDSFDPTLAYAKPPRDRSESRSALRLKSVSRTVFYTLELHQQGLSPAEIAEKRGCGIHTIYNHLDKLLEAGQAVDLGKLVEGDRQAKIERAIEAVDTASLKAIHEYIQTTLGETIDYDSIRLVRAKWRHTNRLDS